MSLLFNTPKTVSEVTSHIRALFEMDTALQDIWVSGEISNMTQASSGHWYFTLKDSDAALRCVMWRSATSKQTVVPKNGDAFEVHGKVSVYEPRGEYQLYADAVRPVGLGNLYQEFAWLKQQLETEGLFEGERKRDPPDYPYKIGVITSPTAAAFQDVLNVLRRRFPLAEVILSSTQVQGASAPPQIIAALERLNDQTDVDVILMCRGGGSLEDLWAFNDEHLARAVAGSRIPVITGVGHETDFTIVDFVSDVRAPTPSAAAEMAVPDMADWRDNLRVADERLNGMMYDGIIQRESDLTALQRRLDYASPETRIQQHRQRADDFSSRLQQMQTSRLALLRERLSGRTAALIAANPQAILARGYAIITRTEDGQRVISDYDAPPGIGITIQLKNGELKARVEDKDSHERYIRTLF
jgi:exodeoxyribonuclease VII large subunit